MIPTIITGLALALIQFYIHRKAQERIDALRSEMRTAAEHARNVKNLTAKGVATAELSYELLHKAVTQLPKTRARKTKAAGIGETEQEA
jgi:hypothetical protein